LLLQAVGIMTLIVRIVKKTDETNILYMS